jgi:hypothetical protein
VCVRTKLGEQNPDAFYDATVAAYLPPTWGSGEGEGVDEALWRVVFDHPMITPQVLCTNLRQSAFLIGGDIANAKNELDDECRFCMRL